MEVRVIGVVRHILSQELVPKRGWLLLYASQVVGILGLKVSACTTYPLSLKLVRESLNS